MHPPKNIPRRACAVFHYFIKNTGAGGRHVCQKSQKAGGVEHSIFIYNGKQILCGCSFSSLGGTPKPLHQTCSRRGCGKRDGQKWRGARSRGQHNKHSPQIRYDNKMEQFIGNSFLDMFETMCSICVCQQVTKMSTNEFCCAPFTINCVPAALAEG